MIPAVPPEFCARSGPDSDQRLHAERDLRPGKAVVGAAYAAALTNPFFQAVVDQVPLLDRRTPGCSAWSSPRPGCPTRRSSTSATRSPRAIRRHRACRPRRPAARPLGRRLNRHRAGRAGRGRPGQRHARAHRGHHRGRGDRDGLGLAGRLGNTGQNIIINTHTDGPNATEENGGSGSSPWPGTWRPCPRATTTCISRWSRGISSCRNSAAPS